MVFLRPVHLFSSVALVFAIVSSSFAFGIDVVARKHGNDDTPFTHTAAATAAASSSVPVPSHVVLTALVAKNNLSALECWQLLPALTVSTASGTVGALGFPHLGATGNGSWSMFTQFTNAGLHNGPAPQWVMVLAGQGELSFPVTTNPNDTRLGGNFTLPTGTLLIVTDTANLSVRGHNTVWRAGSIVLQMPFAPSTAIPEHNVLHNGGCTKADLLA